jgi:hypothetical protein
MPKYSDATVATNCKADFYECSPLHNSDEDLCELRPMRQNSWLQNLHHNANFF